MIKTADQTVMLIGSNGDHFAFEVEWLQRELIRCFLDGGLGDYCSYADDIALAVEFALAHSEREHPVFEERELSAVVGRILENTGFPEIARIFRNREGLSDWIKTDPETLRGQLTEIVTAARLEQTVQQVKGALDRLGVKQSSPGLVQELARYYVATTRLQEAPALPSPGPVAAPGWYVLEAELLGRLSPAEAEWFRSGILRCAGISRVFPCLRLFCRLLPLAEREHWQSPVTELELAPCWDRLGSALDHIQQEARQRFRERVSQLEYPGELPLYLFFPDLSEFTVRVLGAEWPAGRPLAEELANSLTDRLERPVYQLKIT